MNSGLVKAGYWNGTAVSKLTQAELNDYIEACAVQLMEMNQKAVAAGRAAPFPHPRIDACKYELVPIGGGKYMVRARKRPLVDEFTSSDVAVGAVVTGSAQSFDRSMERGKYNDAKDRLVDEDTASLELKELQSANLNS